MEGTIVPRDANRATIGRTLGPKPRPTSLEVFQRRSTLSILKSGTRKSCPSKVQRDPSLPEFSGHLLCLSRRCGKEALIVRIQTAAARELTPTLAVTGALEGDADFSPDERWIVYCAGERERGRSNVEPFSPPGRALLYGGTMAEFRSWLASLMCLALIASGCGSDPGTTAIGAAVAQMTGDAILKRASDLIDEKLQQTEQVGNGMINRAVTGLSVSVEAARISASDVLNKPLSEMRQTERDVFLMIDSRTDDLQKITSDGYRMEEVANLDLQDLASRVGGNLVILSSINGLSVKQWLPEHRIELVGTGLGPGQSGQRTTVTFRTKSGELVPANVDSSQHNRATFSFTANQLQPFFDRERPKTADLTVVLTVDRPKYFGLTRDKREVTSHIVLTTYPKLAGNLSVEYTKPVYNYKLVERKPETFRSIDCGGGRCGGEGRWQTFTTAPVANGTVANPPVGNRRVTNPKNECVGSFDPSNGCRYTYAWENVSVDPTGRFVTASVRVTGVWVDARVSYDVEEWALVGTSSEALTREMRFGEVLKFCLPDKVESATLKGKLVTGHAGEAVAGGDLMGLMRFQARTACAEGGTEYSYLVSEPQ